MMNSQDPSKRPGRRWLRIFAAGVTLLLLLLIGAAWFFSSILLYPKPFRCKKKFFHFCGSPAQQNLPFSEVSFRARDGFVLKGWWIPAAKRRKPTPRGPISMKDTSGGSFATPPPARREAKDTAGLSSTKGAEKKQGKKAAPPARRATVPKEGAKTLAQKTTTSAKGTKPQLRKPVTNAKRGRRVVIFSHGRGSDRRAGMRFASSLHRAGFDVLAFDYRNCGKSQKSFNSMGFHERKDLRAAVDFAYHKQGVKRIGVFGFSLGAAIAILVTAQEPRIRALMTEGGFSHMPDLIVERGKQDYGLPRYPLLPLVFSLYAWRGNLDPYLLVPEAAIAKISPRPVFLIHGEKDSVVRSSHARRLYRAAKQPKSLWIVPHDSHIRSWQFERKKAEHNVIQFFSKAL